jgi:tRNA-specific 2-thiouridylase
MRVLVAMSGGVDSSVAAALLVEQGHEVVGATLKLWGGPSDSGCCSVADVEDARRVAQQLGITHHVFNLTEEFDRNVVAPYVGEHALGRTPNPCIECNRSMKFDRLLHRADRLGFDRLATGHHARVTTSGGGAGAVDVDAALSFELRRGADPAKDQSYVLSMLGQDALARVVFPVGTMTKDDVRANARRLGLRTAGKPDSQDVCFIGSAEGREGFLSRRVELHPAEVVDGDGRPAGSIDAVELVTVGQRRGMGHGSDGQRRYVTHVDVAARRVTVGSAAEAMRSSVVLAGPSLTWVDRPLAAGARAVAQVSAHGRPVPCTLHATATFGQPGEHGAHGQHGEPGEPDASADGGMEIRFDDPQRPVAPGQTVALYDALDPDAVVGAGIAA